MPAFGLVSEYAGSPEAHAGFKVFVANDDRKGLAWMMVLHQGSGSPRRGTVRFHSLETWLFRRRDGRMLAHTRQMADFGDAVAELPGRQSARRVAAAACTGLPAGLRGVGHHPRRGRRVRRAAGLRDTQRDHTVRPGEPRRGDLQQAIDLRSRRGGVEVPLQGRPPQRAASALVRAQRWLLALPDRRLRPPRRRRPASGGVEPRRRSTSGASATASRTRSSPSSRRMAASTARAGASARGAGSSSRVTA